MCTDTRVCIGRSCPVFSIAVAHDLMLVGFVRHADPGRHDIIDQVARVPRNVGCRLSWLCAQHTPKATYNMGLYPRSNVRKSPKLHINERPLRQFHVT